MNSLVPLDEENGILGYVKEKESLKAELKEKDKELIKQKGKVYDLMQKIEELEKELKAVKQSSVANTKQQSSGNSGGGKSILGKNKSKGGKSKQKPNTKAPTETVPTENINVTNEEAQEILKHYQKVAKKYPELKLSVILEAEKVFKEGDINNDGTIDEDELEEMLSKQGHIYTKKELKEIMSQIDADNDNSFDLMEYLAVMERVQMRKSVRLPSTLTKSAACKVQ